MKYVVLGNNSEEDFTLYMAFKELGIDYVYLVTDNEYYGILPKFGEIFTWGKFTSLLRDSQDIIFIMRAGWLMDVKKILAVCDRYKIKKVILCGEQGYLRDWQLNIAKDFDYIFVNNVPDVDYYKGKVKGNVGYFPFGCLPSLHYKGEVKEEYKCDAVVYGQLNGENRNKSFDMLVLPFIDSGYEVNIYPFSIKDSEKYSKYIKPRFGYLDLSNVHVSAKFVLGCHANMDQDRCYGSRLVRMMGSCCNVIWGYSKNMELDGFEHGKNILISKSYGDTVDIIKNYKDNELQKIALEGQKYVYDNFNYLKLIPKMLGDVNG